MKKKELLIEIQALVECGKALALAELMPEGEAKKKTIKLAETEIENARKELSALAEDASFEEVKEMLEDGKENSNTAKP